LEPVVRSEPVTVLSAVRPAESATRLVEVVDRSGRATVRVLRLTSEVAGFEEVGCEIGAAISLGVETAEPEETVVGVRVVGVARLTVLGAADMAASPAPEDMVGRLGVIGEAMESRGTLGATRVGVEVAGAEKVGADGADRATDGRDGAGDEYDGCEGAGVE
jgi:hypothetical protein